MSKLELRRAKNRLKQRNLRRESFLSEQEHRTVLAFMYSADKQTDEQPTSLNSKNQFEHSNAISALFANTPPFKLPS